MAEIICGDTSNCVPEDLYIVQVDRLERNTAKVGGQYKWIFSIHSGSDYVGTDHVGWTLLSDSSESQIVKWVGVCRRTKNGSRS